MAIASALLLLAVLAWQPWHEATSGAGGGQGGGNATPVPVQGAPP